jgi:hypothetical protein
MRRQCWTGGSGHRLSGTYRSHAGRALSQLDAPVASLPQANGRSQHYELRQSTDVCDMYLYSLEHHRWVEPHTCIPECQYAADCYVILSTKTGDTGLASLPARTGSTGRADSDSQKSTAKPIRVSTGKSPQPTMPMQNEGQVFSSYLHSTRLSCEAMICHVPPRFSHVSVQTWHTFAFGWDLSLPTACSLP